MIIITVVWTESFLPVFTAFSVHEGKRDGAIMGYGIQGIGKMSVRLRRKQLHK
jgi:hypothetical protein